MALSKGSYYSDEGLTRNPFRRRRLRGTYQPHAAKVNQHPFEAPSTDSAILGQNDPTPSGGAGLDAIVTTPKVTRPGGKKRAPIPAPPGPWDQ
jgi:hypothetical protein